MANFTHYYLPQEILVEIFSYLPTKSIGKCRCLSKTWNTNLSNSQFIDLHLTRKTHNQENLIIISDSGFLRITTPSIKNSINKSHDTFSIKLSTRIFQLGDKWTKFLGSCNGLILLKDNNEKTFVVNPVTRQQVQIPQPPSMITDQTFYGFGYDSSCHDFKVVALSPISTDYNEKYIVDVYSMKMRVWKIVGYSPYEWCYSEPFMAFVNGAMHWVMHWVTQLELDWNCSIYSFDLATESFDQVPLPITIPNSVGVLQGCLAIFDSCHDDVWVMKEYGVVDSWVRLRIDKKVNRNIDKHVVFVGDGEILCSTYYGEWVLYDLKRKIAKEMFASDYCVELIVFEESIVSPQQVTTLV